MKRLFTSVLVSGLLLTSSATADEYHRYRLPIGTRLTVNQEIYQGFNLVEYKTLLEMDSDLRLADRSISLLDAELTLYKDDNAHLQNIMKIDNNLLSMCEDDRVIKNELIQDLGRKSIDLNEKYAKKQRAFRTTLGVSIAAVVSLVLGLIVGAK